MAKGTIFNFLRYLAMSVAEERTSKLNKQELREKLISEDFEYVLNGGIECVYELYEKYVDEYEAEIKMYNKIKLDFSFIND